MADGKTSRTASWRAAADRALECAAIPCPLTREEEASYRRLALTALAVLVAILFLLRFHHLTHDFPKGITESGVLYTDEGWYAQNAIFYALEGHWYLEKGYNPAVNLPVLQVIQAVCFKVFGFGITTLRVLIVIFTAGLTGVVYTLVRRYEGHAAGLLAAAAVAINHIMFAYSRLSLAEIPMTFFVALAFLLASFARGRLTWGWAALSALAFVLALLTKTSAIFCAPLLAGFMLAQEWKWRPNLVKFAASSAVFFASMTLYYLVLVRPHLVDFEYFHSLNVGLTSTTDPGRILKNYTEIIGHTEDLDKVLVQVSPAFTLLLMLLSRGYRRSPLLYLSVGWFLVYTLMFAPYGRFLPRFFLPLVPAIAIWLGVTVAHAGRLDRRLWPISYTLVAVVVLGFFWNFRRVVGYLAYDENSFAEMAAAVKMQMDADPESNGVLMGHLAPAISLRNGIIPRNDRYSPYPMEERLRLSRPSYYISEGVVRLYPLEPYYRHREWVERLYDMELLRTFEVFENYRGYPIAFYKLHPRPKMWREETP